MQDIALLELMGRGLQNVRACAFGRRVHQGEHVLELISEPERTTRLVEGGPTEDAR